MFWQIKMFPRTSIDNAKAVRQSAHTVHGQMAVSAGKRIARHMPKCVGAWLSGLYDTDRSVVEATQNSLRQVFSTPEKMQNIRKAYQQPILEYCRDAIDKESPQTLSDERTVSPDDMEAKYSRVVSACIAMVGSLVSNLTPEELTKFHSDYEIFLGDKKVWDFASHSDASIRRAVHRFLKTCIAKQPDAVKTNLETISKSYLSVALNSDQLGSAYDYADALAVLTSNYPTVWTEHYHSKTSVDRRLRQYLKKGSQMGPRDFWSRLVSILKALPKEVLPTTGADAAELLNSLHGGIIRKDESRLNLESAFTAYLDITTIICHGLPEDEQKKLLHAVVLPIVTQYLRPTLETSDWTIPPNSTRLINQIFAIAGMSSVIEEAWTPFVQSFINDIKTSAPEQSKDHERSQSSLIKQAARFASVQQQALSSDSSDTLRSAFSKGCASIIAEAIDILNNRNGKPYGAAGVVAELLHKNATLISSNNETQQQLNDFIRDNIPKLILSPSASQLVDILYSMSASPSFEAAWTASLKAALSESDSPAKARALEAILTSPKIPDSFDLASSDLGLQEHVKSSVYAALEGSLEWTSFSRILQSPSHILSSSTTDDILSSMTQSLSLSNQAPSALQGFRHVVKQTPSLLKTFLSTPKGSNLLQSLLLASESPDEAIAQEASAVNSSIQTLLSAESNSKQSMFDVIHNGLRDASQTSVTVETLVELAKKLVKSSSGLDQVIGVFPAVGDWNAALAPFLDKAPRSSLAITNPLNGAVYLVQSSSSESAAQKVARDADGYSPAYRMAQYVTRLLKESDLVDLGKLPMDLRSSLLYNVTLTLQLADDNLGLAGANNLWVAYNTDVEAEAITFISDSHDFVTQELKRLNMESDSATFLLHWTTSLLSNVELGVTSRAYYTARAYSVLISDAIEMHGWNRSQSASIQDTLKTLRRSKGNLASLVYDQTLMCS
jgi:hypothetical protein